MTFNPEFARKLLGTTEADAVRTLRPGGPLDTIWYDTKCLRCGIKVNQTLRFFYNSDFQCPCGGNLDGVQLKQLLVKLTADYRYT